MRMLHVASIVASLTRVHDDRGEVFSKISISSVRIPGSGGCAVRVPGSHTGVGARAQHVCQLICGKERWTEVVSAHQT